jgi:methylmalonyl-CoA/ethylmalonyl-CoA epimerase
VAKVTLRRSKSQTRRRTLPTMQQLQPFITAIDHVGIAVPDFDAAVEFHRDTFGLERVHVELN